MAPPGTTVSGTLVGLQDITLAFGGPPVLDGATLALTRGERVCLLGRNGTGKSTLMKLLDGTQTADTGEVVRQTGVTVARLEQEIPAGVEGSVYDVVAAGLGDMGRLLARYHAAGHRLATLSAADDASAAALRELDRLHGALDAAGAWQVQTRVDTVLQHLALDADAEFASLSGGRKRQVLLARALVREPDVLLLDEPTNHLDVDAIAWMEQFLIDLSAERGTALLFVTHDRAFLRRVATRIVELDRGRLSDWGADYDTYLERKEAALDVEARERAEFDRKLAQEERWVGTSITARRTRNEGRVRALEAMRRDRDARRERVGAATLQVQEADRSGRRVIEARGVSFARAGRPIVRDFSTTISRGDRVGIVGPNGSGKTTLLRLLLGTLPPDAGTVRLGTNLELVYFDQLREQLDPDRTVFDSIADGAEFVDVGGDGTSGGQRKHVHGYLQDFLFPPDRARTPVRALSGGERNRLLLARLFTRAFNLLVLDEPTNDLDIETLDLLEGLLLDYGGTLLLVSHDREFLDHVVTSTLVLEGGGRVGEYAGGYTDWVRQRPPATGGGANAARSNGTTSNGAVANGSGPSGAAPKSGPSASPRAAKPDRPRRLTFAEQRELAGLPDAIDAKERERDALYASLADPALLRDGAAAADTKARVAALDAEVGALTARWEALEEIAAA